MKITGGQSKGRSLFAPRKIIRPTQDQVREAIFNIIGVSFLREAKVLDLFCGSGSFGIEALSRGAERVVFVDKNKECLFFVRKNLSIFEEKVKKKVLLLKADAFSAIRNLSSGEEKFDLIFLDPPYHKGLGKKGLQALDEYDILTANGLIIVEYFKKENIEPQLTRLSLSNTRQYGDTKVSIFKKP